MFFVDVTHELPLLTSLTSIRGSADSTPQTLNPTPQTLNPTP